jgi:hypothetical protein
MSRPLWSYLAAAIVVVAAAASPSSAVGEEHSNRHTHGYNSSDDEHDNLGWVIVSGGITSMSDMRDLESLEDFRHRFGSCFLYLRDGDDHYLIQDEEMIDRAQRAARSIKLYGKEMGMLARFKVQGTLGSRKSARKIAAMQRRPALPEEVSRRSPRDESNERLEREFAELIEDMGALRTDPHQADGTAVKLRDLERRSEDLSKRLEKAVHEGREEMRDVLHDAKAQHLAKRVN